MFAAADRQATLENVGTEYKKWKQEEEEEMPDNTRKRRSRQLVFARQSAQRSTRLIIE